MLDYIRGYLILCIVINHFLLFPSAWEFITGRGILWVSAAEGFFLMSGMMVGLVQGGRYRLSDSIKPVAKRILDRSWKLYLTNFVLVLVFVFIAKDLGPVVGFDKIKPGLPEFTSLLLLAYKVATLQIVYGWADFLNYYVIFLLLSIPALWLLKQKMWYFVLALAVVGWFEPRLASFSFDNYYFYWQVYFFLGMVFGYHYYDIRNFYRKFSITTKRIIEKVAIVTFIATLVLNWSMILATKTAAYGKNELFDSVLRILANGYNMTEPYLYSERSGVFRVIVFFVWAVGIYYIFKHFESLIARNIDWLLGEFGRNSLRVYIISSFLALILPILITSGGFVQNTIVTAGLLLLVVFILKIDLIKKIIPN